MGLSTADVQRRFQSTRGTDPIFAPVDGHGCPDSSSVSLLLDRGVFRVFLPWPPKGPNGTTIQPQFTIQVLADPTACEDDPTFGIAAPTPTISVYRRPSMTANLEYVLFSDGFDFVTGDPQPTDPFTGQPESGNIMWDGREPTLESQATDATLGHAQATTAPTAAQVQQIVSFETGLFSAQTSDSSKPATSLTASGAQGGPSTLETQQPEATFALDEYAAWPPSSRPTALQQSIARGEAIFNTRTFTVSGVAGFNDEVGNNAFVATCSTCHNVLHGASDVFPNSHHDTGVAQDSTPALATFPAADLPKFQLTCQSGTSTPFNGSVVQTSDPGLAIITGQCADIGKFTVPQLRSLAARAPYFHDGSATTIGQLIAFYVARFRVQLSTQDQSDLQNFLLSL
jgi:hypothetical protein